MSTIRRAGRVLSARPRTTVLGAALALVLGGVLAPASAEAQVLPAPGNLTPDLTDGANAAYTDVLLGWSRVPGATSYEVEVSDTSDFSADVLTGSTTATTWALPATVPAADYVWRVRAVASGGVGAWSTLAEFTHSWEEAPANVRVLSNDPLPVVTWDALPGASFYEVEFSTQPDVNENVVQAKDQHFTCYTEHAYLAPYGTAVGKESVPGDEASCGFGYDSTAKDVTDPSANPFTPGKFFPSTDATGNPLQWYVRVRGRNGTPSTTTTPFAAAGVGCTGVWHSTGATADPTTGALTVPVPSAVPAYDSLPDCSSWSPQTPFSVPGIGMVTEDVTTTVTGAVPATGTVVAATPVFQWDAVPGAVKYRVYLGRTRDFRNADHVWETFATSLSPYGTLADNVRYYWGVQACGYGSEGCGPVVPLSFTKTATSPVRTVSTSTTPVDATLTWHTQTDTTPAGPVLATDSEAEAYQVELHRVGTDWPATPVTVDAARLPGTTTELSTTTLPLAGLPDGSYEWRVRAVDQSGFAYPWAVSTPFVRDVTAPTAKLTMPQGFSGQRALTVTFSEPVIGASQAIAVRNSAGAAVAGSVRSSRGVWSFTPFASWTTGETYTFAVSGAIDRAGNALVPTSLVVRAATVADTATAAVQRTGQASVWSARSASDALGRTYLRTAVTRGTALRTTVVGSTLALRACRSPHSGAVAVSVDGRRVATVDLYRGYSGCGTVWSARVSRGQHSVIVAPVPSVNRHTDGSWVGIDAVSTT